MKQLTNQEAFDIVYVGLVTQGAPSINGPTGACAFRADDGRRCAIGFLIPDDLYQKEMDDRAGSYNGLIENWPVLKDLLPEEDLCESLQAAHDDISDNGDEHFAAEIKNSLKNVATAYGLVVPEIPEKTGQ